MLLSSSSGDGFQEKLLLGAEFKVGSRKAVDPRQSLVFSFTAEHSLLVLLG